MQNKLNASDLSAKLLANENISVRRARTRTASFDIKSRVLTLPLWKDMTPEIEGMLNGHEVGHALFTTEDYMEPLKETPVLQGYLNVLEDIRVEKLMKRRYPGIRKTMSEGYKQLNDRDFFGIKQTDVDSLNLIDRINLYYKVGFNSGVKFNIQEKLFVARAENTERVDEVIALAKEIFDYSKTNAEERLREALQNDDTFMEDEDDIFDADDLDEIDEDFDMFNDSESEDSDAEVDEDDKAMESTKKKRGRGEKKEDKTEEQVEKELESKTDSIFTKKLEELADEKTQYNYYTLDEDWAYNPIIGYKTILTETKDSELDHTEKDRKEFESFKLDSSRVVNYLNKEFEMKKSATMYKRAQQAKSGSLDMRKVWAYKLNDDLFKRVTTFPKGKNHGMVFLLDWSGSMDYYLEDTLKQVINLALFCQRAQIPYHVFAFTTQYDRDDQSLVTMNIRKKYETSNLEGKLSNGHNNFALLEFFNNKMSTSEFNTMTRRLLAYNCLRRCKNGSFGTGGTPLNESLSYMLKFIPEFVKNNSIEKMSFITLTDGEGGQLYPTSGGNLRSSGYDAQYKPIVHKHFISDPVTKNSYEVTQNGSTHTEAILRMIKDRYGVNSVGFFICSNTRRVLQGAITANLPLFNGDIYNMVEKMRKEFRDNGFASLKNTGRDDLFIVPINKLAIDQDELQVKEDQSAKVIARNFSKVMGGRRTSRVLLNKFIDYVA